jgi:hypothetical protein
MRLALPMMMGRVGAMKAAVDKEAWKGALPSIALNHLVREYVCPVGSVCAGLAARWLRTVVE